ncbi:hypothetical protein ACHAXA_009563 [Cyclostephanos tholiformis]|uniref:Uncharacterized protein n=1 Tax=Cyclostephanos tholiformis TaxID=382380 RepID=A0ABD3SDP3_9STRA
MRNDIFVTIGQVPETIMKWTTADISHIAEFGWYDWVMFQDNVLTYPDDKLVLGHYLGPAIDMGSALTAKILNNNGQFEFDCPVHTATRLCFDESLRTHLGPSASAAEFMQATSPLTLTTLRTAICLVQTQVMRKLYLSLVTTFSMLTSCCLVAQDNADNPVGLADTNPILDTQSYIIDFADGNQAKLTTTLIVESLYSQCLLTTDDSTMLFSAQTSSRYALMAVLTLDVPPSAGHYAANGRMVLPLLIYNFGTDLPQTVDETLDLDLNTGNTLWAAGIAKEMKNAHVVFQILAVN